MYEPTTRHRIGGRHGCIGYGTPSERQPGEDKTAAWPVLRDRHWVELAETKAGWCLTLLNKHGLNRCLCASLVWNRGWRRLEEWRLSWLLVLTLGKMRDVKEVKTVWNKGNLCWGRLRRMVWMKATRFASADHGPGSESGKGTLELWVYPPVIPWHHLNVLV